jgi:hypothetical protein
MYCMCCTHEFDELPVRHNEEFLNEELSKSVMWGADTSAVLSLDGKAGHVDSAVFADPHTKAFLLVQAFLQKRKLPISDYVNDTKTVLDSVPRLLAAMQFISSRVNRDGSADVVCQLVRAKQLITNRLSARSHPVTQLTGMNISSFKELVNKLNGCDDGSSWDEADETGSIWILRQAPRNKVAEAMKNCKKGTFEANLQVILDSLYALPFCILTSSKVYHEIDKVSGNSVGTVKLGLTIADTENYRSSKEKFTTLVLVLGSFNAQKLLGYMEIPLTQHGQRSLEKEMQFDWKLANEEGGEGGGRVILRLLLDSVRGLDSEVVINLN